jgi:hypothetical protein
LNGVDGGIYEKNDGFHHQQEEEEDESRTHKIARMPRQVTRTLADASFLVTCLAQVISIAALHRIRSGAFFNPSLK